MATVLNQKALDHATALIRDGHVTRNDHGEWSAEQPDTAQENAFIEAHGWPAYAEWHLGVDPAADPRTKRAYSFPYGDFARVDRAGVVAVEERAAQHDHASIAAAAQSLLALIDGR
ncbi:hypothetical protein [uncultured Microbacterium sp.]|uniref:hypothetical protein n=1 Tax=uncultured Microbacterium sp. TaxID=191216 RepID=UPI0025F7E7E4|nr:hypothetical protein [uncultured Microbacterium sp.]